MTARELYDDLKRGGFDGGAIADAACDGAWLAAEGVDQATAEELFAIARGTDAGDHYDIEIYDYEADSWVVVTSDVDDATVDGLYEAAQKEHGEKNARLVIR